MPLIQQSTYNPPYGFRNHHIQTIFPQVFRVVRGIHYVRERIDTPDDDFLDLDWLPINSDRCAILVHGLEGHSNRPYMQAMAKALRRKGWDAVSMNHRGCSGEPNRLLRSYHQGSSDDLYTVIKHVVSKKYRTIVIVGFSLGGNVLLKYLGEKQFPIPKELCCAIAVSAPCDLLSCAHKMDLRASSFYTMRFLKKLHKKIIAKRSLFPNEIIRCEYNKIKTFKEHDNRFTAPFNGFSSAEDYYTKCSSLQFLESISLPTLIINSQDDPFLTPQCSPKEIVQQSQFLHLETPEHGGHLGFISFKNNQEYWHETRTLTFIDEIT